MTRICDWIQQIAAYGGRRRSTTTRSRGPGWRLVAHHVEADPDCADFGTFAARHPALLDKRLLARHYRSSTLAAPTARHDWVEPDLLPFPWSPQVRQQGTGGRQAAGPILPGAARLGMRWLLRSAKWILGSRGSWPR